jgi:hypothetical protein
MRAMILDDEEVMRICCGLQKVIVRPEMESLVGKDFALVSREKEYAPGSVYVYKSFEMDDDIFMELEQMHKMGMAEKEERFGDKWPIYGHVLNFCDYGKDVKVDGVQSISSFLAEVSVRTEPEDALLHGEPENYDPRKVNNFDLLTDWDSVISQYNMLKTSGRSRFSQGTIENLAFIILRELLKRGIAIETDDLGEYGSELCKNVVLRIKSKHLFSEYFSAEEFYSRSGFMNFEQQEPQEELTLESLMEMMDDDFQFTKPKAYYIGNLGKKGSTYGDVQILVEAPEPNAAFEFTLYNYFKDIWHRVNFIYDTSSQGPTEPAHDMAVWTKKFVNSLPDSSFAVIMPGGTKDSEGKTTPRSLRKLPYKDSAGEVDPAHVRNALARLPQTDAPKSLLDKAFNKLKSAAKSVGAKVSDEEYALPGSGVGPGGHCVCPDCGYKIEKHRGASCTSVTCPKCGATMERDPNDYDHDLDEFPYPNFHAARMMDPDKFAKVRVLKTLPNGVMIYGGPLKTNPSGPVKTQAYRFPKDKFTVAQAEAWLKSHDYTPIKFEPATGGQGEHEMSGFEEFMQCDIVDIRFHGFNFEDFEAVDVDAIPTNKLPDAIEVEGTIFRPGTFKGKPYPQLAVSNAKLEPIHRGWSIPYINFYHDKFNELARVGQMTQLKWSPDYKWKAKDGTTGVGALRFRGVVSDKDAIRAIIQKKQYQISAEVKWWDDGRGSVVKMAITGMAILDRPAVDIAQVDTVRPMTDEGWGEAMTLPSAM